MNIQEIISSGLLEGYALGILPPDESRQVEQWLQQFPELSEELAAIQTGLERYAAAHSITPSANVKTNLFKQLHLNTRTADSMAEENKTYTIDTSVGQGARMVSMNHRWKWAAAAAILLLISSVVSTYVYYNKYKTTDTELAEAKHQLDEVAKQNEEMKNDGSIISNPNSIPVSLNGMKTMPDAKAKIFWVKNSGDVFIDATNLPETPAGKQYQFWAIVNGTPVDGGMIVKTKKGGFRLQRMRSFGNAEAFAISLEIEGGAKQPTQVVSLGKVI